MFASCQNQLKVTSFSWFFSIKQQQFPVAHSLVFENSSKVSSQINVTEKLPSSSRIACFLTNKRCWWWPGKPFGNGQVIKSDWIILRLTNNYHTIGVVANCDKELFLRGGCGVIRNTERPSYIGRMQVGHKGFGNAGNSFNNKHEDEACNKHVKIFTSELKTGDNHSVSLANIAVHYIISIKYLTFILKWQDF